MREGTGMTEAEWLTCGNPREMYAFMGARMTRRQCLTFTHACGRRHCRIWEKDKYDSAETAEYWLALKPQIDALCAQAIDAAEARLDGMDREKEIESLRRQVFQLGPLGLSFDLSAALTGNVSCWINDQFGVLPSSVRAQAMLDARLLEELSTEYPFQANLLRHIIGNPFRPFKSPSSWPTTVTALANALYDGEDCHYALADALIEAGHVQLAEHFREPSHPKGCWALDVILGKD